MELIAFLIVLLISGLFIGALSRLLLPGPDPMSLTQTALVGIAGSVIAGMLVYAITGERTGAGLLVSIVVTMGLVYLMRKRGSGRRRVA